VRAAVAAGCEGIGENKAQELVAKLRGVDPLPPVHFIGRLQTNKVRSLAPVVAVYESVDRIAIAEELAKRAPGATVLVQVNATGERDKGGAPPGDAPALVDLCAGLGLHVGGLMTVGPTIGGAEASRPAFRAVRQLCDELGLEVCSMGMSATSSSPSRRAARRCASAASCSGLAREHCTAVASTSRTPAWSSLFGGGTGMAIWKKAMDYLGLGPDDAYDEYDAAPEPEPRPARARQGREGENGARASRAPDYDDGRCPAGRPAPDVPEREQGGGSLRPDAVHNPPPTTRACIHGPSTLGSPVRHLEEVPRP
jgi:hypothetical protein